MHIQGSWGLALTGAAPLTQKFESFGIKETATEIKETATEKTIANAPIPYSLKAFEGKGSSICICICN